VQQLFGGEGDAATRPAQPAMIQTPSRSSTPSANRQIASAGRKLPNGIGIASTTDSASSSSPITGSALRPASSGRRGLSNRSACSSHGAARSTRRPKSARRSERRATGPGNHASRPVIIRADSTISGAPSTADAPGGRGSMLGKAKAISRAPKERCPSPSAISPTVIRALVPAAISRSLVESDAEVCAGPVVSAAPAVMRWSIMLPNAPV
jgi:hypothetical protein